jgi:hypothetical protein
MKVRWFVSLARAQLRRRGRRQPTIRLLMSSVDTERCAALLLGIPQSSRVCCWDSVQFGRHGVESYGRCAGYSSAFPRIAGRLQQFRHTRRPRHRLLALFN